MSRFRFGLSVLAVFALTQYANATTIAKWTFETSIPAGSGTGTLGPYAAEVGLGSATDFHAGATTNSSPAGNGSLHSFSSNNWAVGDYYQFQVDTTGLQNIFFAWDQTSSSTGPRDFSLDWSTNGFATSAPFVSYAVLVNGLPNAAWNSATSSGVFSYSQNMSSVTAINNFSTVYFRLRDTSTVSANTSGTGTVATAGTDRVDNVSVTGSPIPEPITLGLMSVGGLLALRRRRRA